MNLIVEISNLSFSYDNEKVLKEVNLNINKGDFAAFIGSNGSGKSTLLKLIIGLLKVNRGQVKLFGIPVREFRDWSKIGYISQHVRDFNDSFPGTVREVIGANLYSQMGFWKIITSDLESEIDRVLDLVGMIDYKNKQLGNLSGGQQQRVFIARTLVTNPEVIFLDEPLVGVDQEAQRNFYRLLGYLNQELNITVVMISHDVHIISDQANKVVCFKQGKVFSHQSSEFCYDDYYQTARREGKVLVPEHNHQVRNDKKC